MNLKRSLFSHVEHDIAVGRRQNLGEEQASGRRAGAVGHAPAHGGKPRRHLRGSTARPSRLDLGCAPAQIRAWRHQLDAKPLSPTLEQNQAKPRSAIHPLQIVSLWGRQQVRLIVLTNRVLLVLVLPVCLASLRTAENFAGFCCDCRNSPSCQET